MASCRKAWVVRIRPYTLHEPVFRPHRFAVSLSLPLRRGQRDGQGERSDGGAGRGATQRGRSWVGHLERIEAEGIAAKDYAAREGLLRSERALKLAIGEMYVQGVSTRKVTEVLE